MTNRRVVSISMNEEEYILFKKAKEYMSENFLNEKISNSEFLKISNSQFLKYILSDFYYELNETKKMLNE